MLADAIEAKIRSLDDHSPEMLRDTIDAIVRKRFEEGELDECPLTMKDLTMIREAFLRVLVGVYHARVKYPESQKPKRPRVRRPKTGDRQ
jgi:membrane-associated HD superfamily phosphohydrolase